MDFNILRSNFFCILGPCCIESRQFLLEHAQALKEICEEVNIPLVFKSSWDKANRSSRTSFRGIGMERGLACLAEVKSKYNLPICTDVHEVAQVNVVAEVADVIQIPAFLCRQTDLLVAAGLTGKVVQIKKGQWASPKEMSYAAQKVRETGNSQILLTERGSSFGYNNLVVDMRSFDIMKENGYPVVYDATHSVQLPGAGAGISGGERQFISTLTKAAIAAGVNGLFMECHLDPANAKSDAATQWPIHDLKALLLQLHKIRSALDSE